MVVVVVVAAEEVSTGVATVTEEREGKVVSICVDGCEVELKNDVDSVSSSGVVAAACVEVAFAPPAVECIGAGVEAA